MSKRILALFIIPLLLFCGCEKEPPPRLTEEEYTDALTDAWQRYLSGINDVVALVSGNEENIEAIKEKRSEAEELFVQVENAFADFEAMNPPEEYEKRHDKLLKTMDYEKEWVAIMRRAFAAETQAEFTEAMDGLTSLIEAQSYGTGDTFPGAYIELLRGLKYFGE